MTDDDKKSDPTKMHWLIKWVIVSVIVPVIVALITIVPNLLKSNSGVKTSKTELNVSGDKNIVQQGDHNTQNINQ